MSRTSALRAARTPLALVAVLSSGSLGCWEQWSNDWWPQMKWQKAVQAYEDVDFRGRSEGFVPPEGVVPIDGGEAPVSMLDEAAADGLVNPRPADLASLENGRAKFRSYCAPCHGENGRGDGPVSMMGPLNGPFAAVLPVAGPGSIAVVRSDGHMYTTIRYGRRRMPGYARIPSDDRWDIVNYVRYLNAQKRVEP